MRYFIGVGDGYEGYGGDWADFHKSLEKPEGATEYLVEVSKNEFVEYVTKNKSKLDIHELTDEELAEQLNNDEETYITSNGSNDYDLASSLNGLASDYEIYQPGLFEEDDEDDEEED